MKTWLLILLAAIGVGAGAYFWWGLTGVQALQEKSLKFAEVRQVTIRDTISGTGVIDSVKVSLISSKASGLVTRVYKEVGDTVTEDDLLVQLDDREIKYKVEAANTGIRIANAAILQADSSLIQAVANKDAAEKHFEKQKSLEKMGGFSTDREQAETMYQAAVAGVKAASAGIEVAKAKKQSAETALKEAQLALTLTSIKVPATSKAGDTKKKFIILERKVQDGQIVGPQSGPLFMLAGELETVEVRAQIVEGDLNRIKTGLRAVFKIKDYNDDDAEFEGKITRIRPGTNNIKGAVYGEAVIEVKNRLNPGTKEWQLRPGMTASIDVIRAEHAKVWQVPSSALNFKLDEAYLSEATKAKLAQHQKRPDVKDWFVLWTWDEANRQPLPMFVRIGAKAGEVGLRDADGNEILEWEGTPPTGPLRIIIDAPPARPPGFFDQPANVKI